MFRGKRGSVKSALMDQRFLAGIGNIYSDEILFQARLHPRDGCQSLDGEQLSALHRALGHILRIAIGDAVRHRRTWPLPDVPPTIVQTVSESSNDGEDHDTGKDGGRRGARRYA
jgi:hypothetical protein